MRSLLARVGAPRRILPLFAAAVAVQLPTAARAQLVPVGQTSQSEVFTTSLTAGRPYVAVVQPKLRLDDAGVFDASWYATRPAPPPAVAVGPASPGLDDASPALIVNPEPSTFALLAGAGAVLGAAARRRARGRAR